MNNILNFNARVGAFPTIFHLPNHSGWMVIMRLDDWIQVYEEWESSRYLQRKDHCNVT